MQLTSDGVFSRYEEVRKRLPAMPAAGAAAPVLFGELVDEFDVFFFDAFGVLNVGDTVIPGARERVEWLKARGKSTFVITNAASQDERSRLQKFSALGFSFSPGEIVSSRDVAVAALGRIPDIGGWGVILPEGSSRDGLPGCLLDRTEAPEGFWDAGGYVFLSSKDWSPELQERLVDRLRRRPCPVLVGNPDLVAPREGGLSKEPGFFGHDILDRTRCEVAFFGKPFGNVFDAALDRAGAIDRRRVAMVGDTLHTDILGGAAAGIRTVLVTGHGILKGADPSHYIEASGIRPDFVATSI